jgi:hypothetical protein
MSAQLEQWRVNTPEGVIETDLDTLRQWIVEGSVLPTDKVSKGSLGWIDASRAPMLKAAFQGEVAVPAVMPEPTLAAVPPITQPSWQDEPPPTDPDFDDHELPPQQFVDFDDPAVVPSTCYNHRQLKPVYVCPACATGVCEECVKFIDGNRIPTCPKCEEFCKDYEEVRTRAELIAHQRSGFGFADFARALRYPFEHKVALVAGALIYAFLRITGSRGTMIAFVIMFGCMSQVISEVAWGRLKRSFMPDFSEFNVWDDLVVPLFLGLGITLVTWGPVIVLLVALLFGVLNAGPGVTSLVAQQSESAQKPVTAEDLAPLTDPNADPKKLEQANEKLNKLRPGSGIAQEAEQSKKTLSDPNPGVTMLLGLIGSGMLMAVLFIVAIAWAIFYYPMALAVAGYTQSVGAVFNPTVGIDTIRRMGATYFKAFGMVLAVQVAVLVFSVAVSAITEPLALPFFGNVLAKFIDGTVAFYFNLVIACVLGLSLFKCADRLGISVD